MLSKSEARKYAARSTNKTKALAKIRIENDYVTMEELAERLKVPIGTAKSRYHKARLKPDPITWKALGLKEGG